MSTDDYLQNLPAAQKSALQHIRELVHATVPGAEEVISYGMPGFKYKGRYLLGYAAFKNHMSLFPGAGPVADLHDKLADFATSKGTLQFTLDHPMPDSLVRAVVHHRVADIDRS